MTDAGVHLRDERDEVAATLGVAFAGRPAVVFAAKPTDIPAWRTLLADAAETLVLDAGNPAPPGPGPDRPPARGAGEHLARQHDAIAALATGGSALAAEVDRFDPHHHAVLVFPDPLDPPAWGRRPRLGPKNRAWAALEDKTAVDGVWDRLGVPRAPSLVCDLTDTFTDIAAAFERGPLVAACRPPESRPSAGGENLWWFHGPPPQSFPKPGDPPQRVRLMPLLAGLPCRLHGLVTPTRVIAFPPLENVTLLRAGGTFFCAGATLLAAGRPPRQPPHAGTTGRAPGLGTLGDLTVEIGTRLRRQHGYLGGFAVDGVTTADGFRPTELNTRLTSAFESCEAPLRVLLHAVNLLARAGHDPPSAARIGHAAGAALRDEPDVHLYGAARTASRAGSRHHTLAVTRPAPTASAPDGSPDGTLSLAPSPRGWLLHATIRRAALPAGTPVCAVAPAVFAAADAAFGTDFGLLEPPPGLPRPTAPLNLDLTAGPAREPSSRR
jgi:hypothetical protein